jgi:uncharacterized protein YbjT (DUF2867 family)
VALDETILVLGGTGRQGGAVARELLRRGHTDGQGEPRALAEEEPDGHRHRDAEVGRRGDDPMGPSASAL